jgi:hypothetical protein
MVVGVRKPEGVSCAQRPSCRLSEAFRFVLLHLYGLFYGNLFMAVHEDGVGGNVWKERDVKCKCSPQNKWKSFAHTWLKRRLNLPRNLKCS